MKRIILIALCLLGIMGTASAYQFYLSCPADVQVGIPLKCSVDSNLPAGTTLDVVLYQSGYTATSVSRIPVTIQENHATLYQLFDTKGLPGGQYKVEADFQNLDPNALSSDSVTVQLPVLLDRSADITITSPLSQPLNEALRIEGSILKLGNDGVNLEVRGPDGVVFGPQYIGTQLDQKNGAGKFSQKVTVTSAGAYDAYFKDSDGYIGVKTFTVYVPVTSTPTTIPPTAVTTRRTITSIPTPLPTTTKSPLSLLTAGAALGVVGLLAIFRAGKR
jgi:hypothetical protein